MTGLGNNFVMSSFEPLSAQVIKSLRRLGWKVDSIEKNFTRQNQNYVFQCNGYINYDTEQDLYFHSQTIRNIIRKKLASYSDPIYWNWKAHKWSVQKTYSKYYNSFDCVIKLTIKQGDVGLKKWLIFHELGGEHFGYQHWTSIIEDVMFEQSGIGD